MRIILLPSCLEGSPSHLPSGKRSGKRISIIPSFNKNANHGILYMINSRNPNNLDEPGLNKPKMVRVKSATFSAETNLQGIVLPDYKAPSVRYVDFEFLRKEHG